MSAAAAALSFRAKRRLVVSLLALVAATCSFLFIGRLLVAEDPLERADVIYVLGGGWENRSYEAVQLYRGGYAERITLSPDRRLLGAVELEREGAHFPTDAEIARDVLVRQLRLPESAVQILPGEVDNTAQEAELIRPRTGPGKWTRVIVVTDCPSTRRAAFAFRRALGPAVKVMARCSRLDPFDARRWWRTRWGIREVLYETPKLFAYWLGLAG